MIAAAANSGWQNCRLRDVVTKLVDGSHNPPPKQDQGRPMLSARNVDQGQINFDEFRYISNESFDIEHARTRVAPGDVLLTIVGTIGRSAVVPESAKPFALQRSVAVLSPKDGLLPRFLAYQFQSPSIQRYFEQHARGTAQKGVYLKTLGETPILVPPVKEQHAIVAELELQFSRLDEAVANLTRVKVGLKHLKASVINAAVEGRLFGERNDQGRSSNPKGQRERLPSGWRHMTIGELATVVEYGTSARTGNCRDGVPVLRMGNIVHGEITFDSLKYLPTDHEEFPKLHLRSGDMLFNRTNSPELVGKTAVFKGSPAPCSFASYLIRVRFSDMCRPEFASAFINSAHGRHWVNTVVTQQVGQANVNGSKLKQLVVPLPPPQEQCAIVEELDRQVRFISDLSNAVQYNLIRTQVLRSQILNGAFQEQRR